MCIIPSAGGQGPDMSTLACPTSACGVVPHRQPDSERDRVRFSLAVFDLWAVPFDDGGEAA